MACVATMPPESYCRTSASLARIAPGGGTIKSFAGLSMSVTGEAHRPLAFCLELCQAWAMGSTHRLSGPTPLLVLLAGALLACKLGKSDDDPETRPLPAVEGSAPAPVQATPPQAPKANTPAAPAKPSEPTAAEPKQGEPAAPGTAKQGATTGANTETKEAATTTSKQDQASTSKGEATTGAQKEAEKEQGTTGTIQGPNLECLKKCVEALRECTKNAQIGDDVVKNCQGAFTTCRSNCT